MTRHPFAALVTTDTDGEPFVTHLPLLLSHARDYGGPRRLVGHVARVSAQAEHLRRGSKAMAIFQGPHAYVSPRWYQVHPSVPTWNYIAVHAYGGIRVLDDEQEAKQVLDQLTRAFEPAEGGWQMNSLSEPYVKSMVAGIVAFEMRVDRLEGKYKLSQNRSEKDRLSVIAALASGNQEEREIASEMQKGLHAIGER